MHDYFPKLVSINWIPITICHDSYQQCSLGTYCFKLWWNVLQRVNCYHFQKPRLPFEVDLQPFTVLWCSWFFSSRIPKFPYSKFLWTLPIGRCSSHSSFTSSFIFLTYKCDSLLLRTVFLSTYKSVLWSSR